MKAYTKPVISIEAGIAEGVYAASGSTASATLDVSYWGVWDRWGTNGGKGLANVSWSNINGTITLNITFSMEIQDLEVSDASVQKSFSGNKATLVFASTASNPLQVGIHIEQEGSNVDNLSIEGFTYSVA